MAKKEEIPKFEDTEPLFEETTPVEESPTAMQLLGQKAKDLGTSTLEGAKSIGTDIIQGASDLGRGGVQGLTAGLSDEAIAAVRASLPIDENKDQDWKALFRKYQEQEQAKNLAAQERSPILYKGAELGGMLIPAIASAGATAPAQVGAKLTAGALAKKAGAAALTGAVTGGIMGGTMSEKGKLIGATPEEEEKLKADIIGGTVTGGVVGGVLGTAIPLAGAGYKAVKGKVGTTLDKYISDSPFWTQVKKSKELGEKGTNIYSEEAAVGPIGEKTGLIHQDTNATRDLVDRIYAVDTKLGQKVGESVDNATNKGVVVDLTEPMLNSVKTFADLIEKDQNLAANPKAKKLYDTIFQMADDSGSFDASNLTPKEVQTLRQDVSEFAESIKLKNPDVAGLGFQFQGQIGDLLKNAVPEYKVAAERFEQFRRLVPETVISGATPVDISKIKLGNLKNDEAKLFSSAKNMIQGSRMPGTASADARETAKNVINGVNEFENSEIQRFKEGILPANDNLPKLVNVNDETQASGLQKLIKDRSDDSALLQQAWRVNPQEGAATSIKGATFGRSSVINMANKYGLYKDALLKPIASPVALTKKMYNASEDELRGMAQKMSDIPGLQSIGKALINGLDNKDVAGVNATMFSIMQNPQARILINSEDIQADKEKENK